MRKFTQTLSFVVLLKLINSQLLYHKDTVNGIQRVLRRSGKHQEAVNEVNLSEKCYIDIRVGYGVRSI